VKLFQHDPIDLIGLKASRLTGKKKKEKKMRKNNKIDIKNLRPNFLHNLNLKLNQMRVVLL
jgi:hypothetical protein